MQPLSRCGGTGQQRIISPLLVSVGILILYSQHLREILIAEIGFLVHIQREVRGWILFFVWLLAVVPEARAAFLVEYQGGREPVQIHSILSVNPDGVILRPLGGGFGNGVRHRWDQFTVRTLGVLMSELLKDPLFNQKSRDAKFKIILICICTKFLFKKSKVPIIMFT